MKSEIKSGAFKAEPEAGRFRGAGTYNAREPDVLRKIIALLVIAGAAFIAGGLFAWQHLGATLHADPSGSPRIQKHDWGDVIVIEGKDVNVSDYFIDQINEEDIKKYLA